MTRLIRVELLKVRTTRLSYGLLATAAGLTTMFAVLNATRGAALDTPSGLTTQITVGPYCWPRSSGRQSPAGSSVIPPPR